MFNDVIFREYDIRGVFNKDYDLDFAYKLGLSYISFLQNKAPKSKPLITLGYDARSSSLEIKKALTQGLIDGGAQVYQLGLITSPISYFSTFCLPNCSGAIMITGSHNPPEYNGFKISLGQSTLFGSDIQELKKIIREGNFYSSSEKGEESAYNIFPEYVERYKKEFKNLKPFPFVLDCGNGAAGSIVRKLYESLGLKPHILFEEPDGNFPNHHPDPTVEKNLTHLKELVLSTQSRVGIGFDGDADRIGIVDENGRFILGDELLLIYSRAILKSNPGSKIVGDVKCSDRLYEDIEKKGGIPIMWKTGHSLIKEKIKTEKAPFGGEMSGHVFFADRNYGYDDALYAGLRLCEILSETGLTVTQLLEDLPPAFNTPEIRIDTTEEKKQSIVMALKEKFNNASNNYKLNLLDGIRISYSNGWALARASNTQPVLVLRFESSSPEGLKKISDEVYSVVNPLLIK